MGRKSLIKLTRAKNIRFKEYTLGYRGYFSNNSDLVDFLSTATPYTLLSTGGAKATISVDTTSLSISTGTLPADTRPGDLWSPDGVTFYQIKSVDSTTSATLSVPSFDTYTDVDLVIARPIIYRILLTDNFSEEIDLSADDRPIHVDFRSLDNCIYGRNVLYTDSLDVPPLYAGSNNFTLGKQHVVHLNNITATSDGAVIGNNSFLVPGITSVLTINNSILNSFGVDCIYPLEVGTVTINNSYCKARQDIVQPRCRGGFNVNNSIIVGDPIPFLTSFVLPVQHFRNGLDRQTTVTNSVIIIEDSPGRSPLQPNLMISCEGATSTKLYSFTDTEFIMNCADAANNFLLGSFGATKGGITILISGGKITWNNTSGTPTICQSGTYSPASTLTTSGFDRGGAVDGGGTGLTITHL